MTQGGERERAKPRSLCACVCVSSPNARFLLFSSLSSFFNLFTHTRHPRDSDSIQPKFQQRPPREKLREEKEKEKKKVLPVHFLWVVPFHQYGRLRRGGWPFLIFFSLFFFLFFRWLVITLWTGIFSVSFQSRVLLGVCVSGIWEDIEDGKDCADYDMAQPFLHVPVSFPPSEREFTF